MLSFNPLQLVSQ